MSDALHESPRDATWASARTLRLAFVLSLMLHAAALWHWLPRLHELSVGPAPRDAASGPLQVQLAPPVRPPVIASPAPAARPAPEAAPPAPKRAPPPTVAARPAPRPPVIAQERPAPPVETPVAQASPPAPPAPPAVTPLLGDFYTDLESRRRTRLAAAEPSLASGAASSPEPEDERARHNRIVAANLGLDRAPTYGREPTGGGIFQLQRMGYDEAEFVFFGWNKDIRRKSKQTIEVRKGDNPDIRIAVVRRIIGIIRDHESGDFVWVSERLGRTITLSARPSENAGLEDFMLQEFFGDPRRRQ